MISDWLEFDAGAAGRRTESPADDESELERDVEDTEESMMPVWAASMGQCGMASGQEGE
ncbi:hypothetical protein HETIRDRAFT_440595 [Heterobasidion irregulare TC 32-1]|uniref:Uncharacterized protein n=1 Tax=Heterobasidion irregulare (strain TC 32-1) TaxID=747525 RepID=W4K7K6_HETIT|nr:uncharacterized protein HETIRDRAFT_440595 [Heterobasidion irregulare TC 32-1]ETW81056.1 hypothetical protein HETIRDRAFT_440595 [Heterobasidion irregulare TC 32-1]